MQKIITILFNYIFFPIELIMLEEESNFDEPMDSSAMCAIPVKFVERPEVVTNMNSIERHHVNDIRDYRKQGKKVRECRICL